jgi:mannose-6-phosphate isomerase-like protein (cupin superfamily)
MNVTPPPISLDAARKLPWRPGRSAEAFVDGDLEIRFTPAPSRGMQTPHERDELYLVASGTGHYRVEDRVSSVAAGDLLFAAAHVQHGFEDFSEDFAIWIIFYGPVKHAPAAT